MYIYAPVPDSHNQQPMDEYEVQRLECPTLLLGLLPQSGRPWARSGRYPTPQVQSPGQARVSTGAASGWRTFGWFDWIAAAHQSTYTGSLAIFDRMASSKHLPSGRLLVTVWSRR